MSLTRYDEDGSEELICYPVGLDESQSNPQPNRVTSRSFKSCTAPTAKAPIVLDMAERMHDLVIGLLINRYEFGRAI